MKIYNQFERALKSVSIINNLEEITQVTQLYGGSINDSYKVETKAGIFFVKMNHQVDSSKFYNCEARGLRKLKRATSLHVPKVFGVYSEEDTTMLIMEFIEEGAQNEITWEHFGRGLAELHANSKDRFGLDYDNYIGSLPQSNRLHSNWADFFRQERLEFQFNLSSEKRFIQNSTRQMLEKVYLRIEELIPIEQPALLHGDLWSGNFKITKNGEAAIFDPAIYFGHREADIAMMHLFGGFNKRVFESYNEAFPLEKEWAERIDLFNLYPLLVHVNLFGASYVTRLNQVLKKFF